jgi:predicted RNase H-like HicB family nuclease
MVYLPARGKVIMKRVSVRTQIPVFYLKEGKYFVCYTPAFDLAASGETLEEAKKSFDISYQLIIEETIKDGSLEEMLESYGWTKIRNKWSAPQVVGQESKDIQIPVHA